MVARALSAEPLVWVGKRSYSIYLWHYPLLLLMNPVANINDTPWWQYILQVLLVVAVAECSYRFIETPFRKGAFGRTVAEFRDGTATPANWARAHVPVCAACAVVLVVALGGLDLCAGDLRTERRGRRSPQQRKPRTPRPPTNRRPTTPTRTTTASPMAPTICL